MSRWGNHRHSHHSQRPPADILPRAHSDENNRRRTYGRVQPMDRPRKPGAVRQFLRNVREHEGRSFFVDLAILTAFLVVIVLAIVAVSPFDVVGVEAGI